MTRSSESASIAHYELQNTRRELLLSQNQTASESEEEDINASLNTEEMNMNMLLFDYEMIKISISTELNAWISVYETNDIVIFIKYICQQHDIEIKIYNDMIQILEDVNEIRLIIESSFKLTFWIQLNLKLSCSYFQLDSSRIEHIFNSTWFNLTRNRVNSTQLVKNLSLKSRKLNIEIFPLFCIIFLHYLFAFDKESWWETWRLFDRKSW